MWMYGASIRKAHRFDNESRTFVCALFVLDLPFVATPVHPLPISPINGSNTCALLPLMRK